MNALAIVLGLFLFMVFSFAGGMVSVTAIITGLSLIFVGITSRKKKNSKAPFYLSIISFISFFILTIYSFLYSSSFDWGDLLVLAIFMSLIGLLINHHKPHKAPAPISTTKWSWAEGKVDTDEEHFELRYGSVEDGVWDAWTTAAYIAPAKKQTFYVKFVIEANNEENKTIIEAVKKQLSFYLTELNNPDPWDYAKYHCGTASDMYSMVHWSYFPKGWIAPPPINKNIEVENEFTETEALQILRNSTITYLEGCTEKNYSNTKIILV